MGPAARVELKVHRGWRDGRWRIKGF